MAIVTFNIKKDDKPAAIARPASAFSLLVCLEKNGEKTVSIIEKAGAKHTLTIGFDDALDIWQKAMKKNHVGVYRFKETNDQGWGPIAITAEHVVGIDDVDGKVLIKLKNGAEIHLVQTLEEAVQRWNDSLATT